MWVVNRVHDRTTDRRAYAGPTCATGFTDHNVGVLGISDLTDGSAAGEKHAAQLGGRKTQNGISVILTHELYGCSRRTCHCGTFAGLELNCVHERTHGNLLKRCAVAGLNVNILCAGNNRVTNT